MLVTIKAVITMIIQSLTQIHSVTHTNPSQIQSSVRWILCVEDVTLHRKYEGVLTTVQVVSSQLP